MHYREPKRNTILVLRLVLALFLATVALVRTLYAGEPQVRHSGTFHLLGANAILSRLAYDGTMPRPHEGQTGQTASLEYAPGQIVVKYRGAEAPRQLLAATSRWQTRVLGQQPQLGVVLLQVPLGAEQMAIAQLRRDARVRYAELNYRVHAQEIPSDEKWPEQWALQRIAAPEAWDIAHCQGTVVAVLDTGVHLEHPDLRNALWTNSGEVPNNGLDDDGNGKVDDVHGWHFYLNCSTGTCQPYENPIIQDDNGHGTHVTGIATAETGNGIGIASVSWGAQAMIVKVLDEYGDGYYSDIAAGIVYATDNGAQVINLSFGGDQPSQLLQDAVDYAHQKGVLLVAAAGNDGGMVLCPAACEHVVAVAATDRDDQRAVFSTGASNHGPEVDIAAPGKGIVSTWPPPYQYLSREGTSMAAPHVAGAAALLWSWRPDYTNEQIQHRLESQADDVNAESHPGRDPYLGWGRLNLYQALAGLPPGPTLTPSPTRTTTPTATATVTPTHTATPVRYLYYLLPIFKDYTPT
jgi:subtilisin family serine protease